MRTLNLKPTTVSEVCKKWGTHPTIGAFDGTHPLFVRCNSKGVVNWEKALVYSATELKNRKTNVHF